MATEEHKYLADFIKSTHATLREEAENYGFEIAWQKHVTRKDVLQKYSTSMKKLATTYWTDHNSNSEYGTRCRVEWINSECKEYFFKNGKRKYHKRETDIKHRIDTVNINDKRDVDGDCNSTNKWNIGPRNVQNKVTLLDVGSCYNPFSTEDIYDVTAIDLIGIRNHVLQCDFLNVNIGEENIVSDDNQEVSQLAEESFDVVVFSLFLEYLPCPEQRYRCCKKAYDLLKPGGILFIVSPDSNHVNANARFMKSWRYVLSNLGFMRIKYEKLRHIHCLMFRKCVFKSVALRWIDLQRLPENDPLFLNKAAIYIPQDFRNKIDGDKERKREEYDADELSSMFGELPLDFT